MINLLFTNLPLFVLYITSLLLAITVHEFSHAFVADYLGDPTPRLQGRLKLDPRVHIDNFGMIFLLLFGFGWGKPVQFDPYNLKNPRSDAAWISIAGPISNFILALVLAISLRLFMLFHLNILITIGIVLFIPIIQMNLVLGIFNLLPIDPLDGFKIVGGILNEQQSKEWYSLQRYGMIFLILIILPLFKGASLLDTFLRPTVSFLFNLLVPGAGII